MNPLYSEVCTILILCIITGSFCSRSEVIEWEQLPSTGDIPKGAAGSVMGCFRDELVIFGGARECVNLTGNSQAPCVNEFDGDIYIYSLRSNTWRKPNPGGVKPDSRSFHRGVSHARTDSTYFYGGVKYSAVDGTAFETFSDFRKYNKKTNMWTQLANDPGTRIDPGIAISRNKIYLFGGLTAPAQFPNQTDTVMRNDLWEYDIETNMWNLIIPNDPNNPNIPEGRYQCRFDYNERHRKFLLTEGDVLPDNWKRVSSTWILDEETWEWTRLDNSDVLPLFTGISATYEDKLYKMGGEMRYGWEVQCRDPVSQKKNNPVNIHYALDFTQPGTTWAQVFPSVSFPPTEQSAYCRYGKTLYMWGGFSAWCEATGSGGFSEVGSSETRQVTRFRNTVWKLDLPSNK